MEDTDDAELQQGFPNKFLSFDRVICFELIPNQKATKSVAFSHKVFLTDVRVNFRLRQMVILRVLLSGSNSEN